MTWKTHCQGITTSSIILYPIVVHQLGGMDLDPLKYTILCLTLFVLINASARFGTITPDLDHHSGAIPQKSAVTIAVNKLMHLVFRGKYKLSHRSWQTHSVDLYLLFGGLPAWILYQRFLQDGDVVMYQGAMILCAFTCGAIIHCVMDMFTTKGVWASIILAYILSIGKRKGHYKKYRVRLAPTWFWYPVIQFRNSRGKFSMIPHIYRKFPITDTSTGGDYEDGFRELFVQFNYLFLIITVGIYIKTLMVNM